MRIGANLAWCQAAQSSMIKRIDYWKTAVKKKQLSLVTWIIFSFLSVHCQLLYLCTFWQNRRAILNDFYYSFFFSWGVSGPHFLNLSYADIIQKLLWQFKIQNVLASYSQNMIKTYVLGFKMTQGKLLVQFSLDV